VILGRAAAAPLAVAVPVAVIDGPYDATARPLSGILARAPARLGDGGWASIRTADAQRDALIPGICPEWQLLHVPLFMNEDAPDERRGAGECHHGRARNRRAANQSQSCDPGR
jgi:hypothetical protein